MSAAAHVTQLLRAHYRGDEAAFKAAAEALGRSSKSPQVRDSILALVRDGSAIEQARRRQASPPAAGSSLAPLLQTDGLLRIARPCTFPDLLLGDELQATLDELVVELEYRAQLAARNLAPRSRLLFYGPPGNGKSSAGSAIASALGLDAYVVSLPDLVSQYIGGTGANLGKLFDGLSPNRVVVFDELDAIGSSRADTNTGSSKEQNATVNVMLTLMDRAQGIIIATTNRLEMIDPALKRRFDEAVHFPAPSVEQMRSLAVKVSAPHDVTAPGVDDCKNFDEVTKRCLTHARREAMRQILADEAAEGEQDGN